MCKSYDVMVIEDLCRYVTPKTSEAALKEMRAKGITVLKSFDLEKIKRF